MKAVSFMCLSVTRLFPYHIFISTMKVRIGTGGKKGGGAAREYVVGKEHATKNSKAFLR